MAHYNVGKNNPMYNVHLYGRIGLLANNYKHGKFCKEAKFYCKCGRQLSSCQATICRECADKEHSERLKGKKRPELSKLWKGRNNPRFGKPAVHSKWVKYKNIFMRSNWEVLYVKYLDKNNIEWLYEPKTFNLGDSTYTPDFYLPKIKKYIEVKGYWRNKDINKFNLFRKKYSEINISVLKKENLQNLGIKL